MIDIIHELNSIFSDKELRTDQEALQTYGTDWTRFIQPAPLAVVFPKTTQQVQDVVKLANKLGVALVPSGGRTGLSAGAVAANQEIVVSFERMNRILDFNQIDRTVHCQAGVITEQLQDFAKQQDLFYPVDFASSGSSQIGGNIATNAGGIKVIHYDGTRHWVAGLTVVTGTGELLELNHGLVKNATGYDLRHLFIGSEGTLGFIVEATLRLTRLPKSSSVLVLGVEHVSHIMNILTNIRQHLDLTAFEFFSDKALKHVIQRHQLQQPFATATPFYALLEFERYADSVEQSAMDCLEYCMDKGWVIDGVLSQSESQAQQLWQLRENITESISPYTPYKNDISVNISQIPQFIADVESVVNKHYPDFEIVWFGHIGDGNVHLNILKPEHLDTTQFLDTCGYVNKFVFEIVQKYNGSISAEHGIGLLKKDYLHYSRSPSEINYMKSIKQIFDPNNILNPGKVF